MDTLTIAQDVPLADYSTMRLGGTAAYATAITSRQQAASAYTWATSRNLPWLVVGSGSNIVWRDEGFPGLLIVNRIEHYEAYEEDERNVYLTVGAGENWDKVVARSVAAGLTGIEALSLVPGTAGATPIQNVGAYGQDISQTLSSIEAYDTKTGEFTTIPVSDCDFGYRTSRFKTTDRGRFLITAITLHLAKDAPQPPFYAALQRYLDEHQITTYTPADLRQAVMAIRSSKLPDPSKIANNGSFFANPIVDESTYIQLAADYDNVPHWPVGDRSDAANSESESDASHSRSNQGSVKLSAAWLLDQAGFKDFHDPATGMATWPAQPLVLVNEKAHNTADLLAFRQKIIDAVQTKFGITLEQEPELLPLTD